MKHLKMLGLAAIAALGLMAFVGAGTASATTLFTDEGHTIPYPSGTTIHATLETGTSATLTNTSGSTLVTCTESTVHGTISTATGTSVSGGNSALTWGGCNNTTDTINAGSLEIMQTTGNEGSVVSKAAEVTVSIFGVSCIYGTGEGTNLGNITGGPAPTLKITAIVQLIKGGFLCPTSGIWHAAYTVTTPHAIYIGA